MQKNSFMYIDDIPVVIENEKNILDMTRKAGIEMPPSATIPNCRSTAPAVCVWWRMTAAVCTPLAPPRPSPA